MKTLFTLPVRIYYEDTDAGGIVYHANYLKFFERARSEFLFQAGIDLRQQHSLDVHFAVVRAEVKFSSPAHLGDLLNVTVHIKKIHRASVVFFQEIIHPLHARKVCSAEIQLACVNSKLKPVRILPELLKILME